MESHQNNTTDEFDELIKQIEKIETKIQTLGKFSLKYHYNLSNKKLVKIIKK
jgi:hypothetical protein